jgi:hypothetical protein
MQMGAKMRNLDLLLWSLKTLPKALSDVSRQTDFEFLLFGLECMDFFTICESVHDETAIPALKARWYLLRGQ